jgi:hypothetical protein
MGKMKKQSYDLEEGPLEYSAKIIKIVESLPMQKKRNNG